jgi:hypothetical protein
MARIRGQLGDNSSESRRSRVRREGVEVVHRVLMGGESLVEQAHALVMLQDVRVRDTVLRRIAVSDDHHQIQEQARSLAIRAPQEMSASVFALVAALCWQAGDGARATMALESALTADPRHSLCLLLRRAIAAGLPPRRWIDAVLATTEEQCLSGGAGR